MTRMITELGLRKEKCKKYAILFQLGLSFSLDPRLDMRFNRASIERQALRYLSQAKGKEPELWAIFQPKKDEVNCR